MHEFRRLRFGTVPSTFTDAQVISAERFLVSYVRSCSQVSILTEIEPTLEVFQLARLYIGSSFKNWLVANYANGSGVRASFCKAIAAWAKGTLSDKAVIAEIKRDLNRLSFINENYGQLPAPIVYEENVNTNEQEQIGLTSVTDKTFFDLLALIGPELTAYLCLSLNGVRPLN